MPGNFPRRGDIYHIEFGGEIDRHFAVVVTVDSVNKNASTVLFAVITTKRMKTIYPHEFRLPAGLLPKPSKVKCHTIIMWPKETLNQSNYIGTINQRDMQGLDVSLAKALDLWI